MLHIRKHQMLIFMKRCVKLCITTIRKGIKTNEKTSLPRAVERDPLGGIIPVGSRVVRAEIIVSSSEAEESARYLTNRPQADSEKTKTFKRKIHPLRGWIFIHAAGFFDGVSAVTSRCAERIYQSRFLDKSRGVFVCRHRAVNPIFPPLSRHGAQVRLA